MPSNRRIPPQSLTPRAKTHNYLNMIVGDQEVQSQDPEAWAVLLDLDGNFAEGLGSNIFFVRDGELLTPREKFVLPGVSRQTVIDLAASEKIPCREADLDLYDAYNADEIFLTSTSLCICPVTRVNGAPIGPEGQVFGPVTRRLVDAYVRFVDHDFVAQYLRRLGLRGTVRNLRLIADDLTGALDAAAPFAAADRPLPVRWPPLPGEARGSLVLDTETREVDGAAAADATRAAAGASRGRRSRLQEARQPPSRPCGARDRDLPRYRAVS